MLNYQRVTVVIEEPVKQQVISYSTTVVIEERVKKDGVGAAKMGMT